MLGFSNLEDHLELFDETKEKVSGKMKNETLKILAVEEFVVLRAKT